MSITSRTGTGGMRFKTKVAVFATTIALSGAAVFTPIAAVADHSTQHTIDQLLAQIAALQLQLNSLSGGGSPSTSGGVQCNFTRSLTVGSTGDDVMCLQRYLNGAGFQLASSGAGSPGSETSYFGPITRSAVMKWQDANAAQVLTPVGLTSGTGYFGPSSRSHYSSMMAALPPPAPVPTPTPTPTPGPTPTTPPAAVGSGLTVSAPGSQPASTLYPENASRIPMTRFVLTASADGDVTVNSITIERMGLGSDTPFNGLVLLDDQGNQIGLSKTLNALHQAKLNQAFVVKAGTSMTMTIGANSQADHGSQAGETPYIAIVAVDAGTSAVNGALPIVGNPMTVNSTLVIGTFDSPTRGPLDPGAARTNLEVGTQNFISSSIKFTAGSAEPVELTQVRWYQAGSAAAGDLMNTVVIVDGVQYPATISLDGKYYVSKFSPGIEVDKGENIEISIQTNVDSGSDRTVDFDIRKREDIVARGKTFGYNILPGTSGLSSGTPAAGTFSSDVEPYYNGFAHTVAAGSLRVEKSNDITAGNIAVDVSNTPIGSFNLEAKGEPIQISSFTLNFTFVGTGTSSDITNVTLVDENGNVVAGPSDPSSGVVTWTDTWSVPVGLHTYTVKAKMDTTFTNDTTIVVGVLPNSKITARGETTGLNRTPTPSSNIQANTQTIKRASLTVSVSTAPSSQNVVAGINGYLFSTFQFDATDSGEDLRVTSAEFTLNAGTSDIDTLNTCQAFDGATALNTGSNVINPSGNAASADVEQTFTFDTHLIVPKGTVKNIDVKCNISSNTVAGWYWIGLSAESATTTATSDFGVTGKDTAASVTETVIATAAGTMTVSANGTLTVALDTSSPSQRFAIAGKTDVLLSVLKLTADNEAIKLNRIGLTLASTTASTSDVTKVTLWDGATKVGEAVFSGTQTRATSTLTTSFIIPKDGTKLLTIKADMALLGTNQPATRGHLIEVDYDGEAVTTTRGIGQSSGVTINPSSGTDTNSAGVRIVKSYPTLERLSVPSNTLANGQMTLYRFKVTADPAGDVALYKMTFTVSSTTAATTSLFSLYAYNDSGFSTQAYAANPVNANDVDCVGSNSLETGTNDSCSANNETTSPAIHQASSTEMIIYFDPSTNSASAPNAEAISVPAGTTRYFELRGSVSNAVSGDSISVALQGDAAFASNTSTVNREKADTIDTVGQTGGHDDFIWSPNTTSTVATTTNDWLNGWLVPGLPTTEMTQQTFTK